MNGPKPAPIMLVAGGPQAKNNELILKKALKLSPAPKPSLAYIGAASCDNPLFFEMIGKMLMTVGASSVTLVPVVQKFNRKHAEDILAAGDLIFVSGGDVASGMNFLKKRNLIPYFNNLYRSGKPFIGLSAGSIMLCRNWLSWRNPNDDNTVKLIECLGFAPLLCDVHDEEGGWAELKKLLSFFPEGTKGYGIPASGALLVTSEGNINSIGKQSVEFVRKGKFAILQKS